MVEETKTARRKLQLVKETLHRLDAPAQPYSRPIGTVTVTASAKTSCNINCSMTCGP